MSILVVAAHPDDEALGCGGAMRRHADAGERVDVLFVADGVGARGAADTGPEVEARRRAADAAAKVLGAERPRYLDFPDNRLDSIPLLDVVQAIESVIAEIAPDAIYTHHAGDLNIDHGVVARAVLTACRPQPGFGVQRIHAFEVPSSTEWAAPGPLAAFTPQRFVDISAQLDSKLAALEAYAVEMRPWPHPRSAKAVTALARTRGATVGLEAAEAFEVLREIVS